jgi:hypothetical protein
MNDNSAHTIRENYDRMADAYARQLFTELHKKPLDRELLDRFAAEIGGHGEICDMGCGPVRSLAICGMPGRESLGWISLTEW